MSKITSKSNISKVSIIIIFTFLMSISIANASLEKQWPVMKAGNPYLLSTETTDEMSLYQVIFFSAEEQKEVAIKITFEPGTQSNIYQKIIINKTNMNEDLLSGGSIKLKVANEWIEKNVPNGSSVKLADEQGKVLAGNNILFSRKGDVYSYYSASVPMKTFYIATSAKPAATTTNATTADTTAEVTAQTQSSNSTTQSETTTTQTTTPKAPEPAQPAAAPTCEDNIQNQDETDVDCGGACKRCEQGRLCTSNDQCQSQYCSQGTCKVPTCSDFVKNQQESDVDCGGLCSPCGTSGSCNSDQDCATSYCREGICQNKPVAEEKSAEAKTKSAFNLNSLKFDLNMSVEAKNNLKNIALGVLGLAVLVTIIIFAKKSMGGKRRDPSVQDLVKLYDDIKRI